MNKKYLWAFLALMALYITLAFTLPTDPELLNKYGLSQNKIRLLNVTVILPICVVYLSALYGFLRFRAYAESVKKTKEGTPLFHLSTGLMLLAFGLPISSILGALTNYFSFQYPELVAAATIVRNYVSLMFQLAAFFYIAKGTEGLLATLKNKTIKSYKFIGLAGPIVLTSLFTLLVTVRPNEGASEPIYFMPNILVILTLAVPYVYIWCVGINAARNLYLYKDRVKGLIYKRAIDYLAKGMAMIIFLSIFLQFVTTLSERLNRLNLTPLLIIVYVLVAMYALGYGFVARGAKKLKQIEEA